MSILRHPTTSPAVLVALVVGLVVWLVAGPVIGAVVVVVAAASFAALVGGRAATVVRKGVGARPANLGEFPRLHNTVDGLCLTHGIEPPALSVVDSSAGNALVLAGSVGTELVLTTGAVDHLGLVELESLVAHLLARCAEPDLRTETIRAGLGSLRALSGGRTGIGTGRVLRTDFAGADLTRFPPGMQDALRALVALGSAVMSPSGAEALWLLQPDGRTDDATADHPPVEVRINALGEL